MNLYQVITAAVRDLEAHGYDSIERVARWSALIREAAEKELVPPSVLAATLRDSLGDKYRSLVEGEGLAKKHKGIERFTLDRIKPKLRAELDRRIMASAEIVKLNREQAIEKTLQRFRGWATSIPIGGSGAVDTNPVKANIRKSMAQLPFEERRVLIDQGHKLVAAINNIVATDGGAIAMVWESHWRQAGYNYRKDHKDRDGMTYAIRGCWAMGNGLMKKGPAGYLDEITQVGEEPFCRCSGKYIYSLRDLPEDMITAKGAESMAAARAKIQEMRNARNK